MDQPYPPPPPPPPPPPFVPPPPAEAPIPWETPGLPPAEALIETVKLFIVDMEQAFRRMPVAGDISRPLLYAVIVGSVGPIVAQIYSIFLPNPYVHVLRRYLGSRVGEEIFARPGIAGVFGIFVVPVAVVFGIFLGAGIVHLCLMLVGGATNGFVTTLRVVCYASTGQLAQVVPIIGGLVAMVFVVILEVRGLATAHRTTVGKAIAAVLIPVGLCCVCVLGLIAAFGAVLAGLIHR